MPERIVSIAVSLCILTGAVAAQERASTTSANPSAIEMEVTLRKTVQEVHLDFALSSQNGRPVPGLNAEDFTLYQDNQPLPAITGFYADQNLPLHLLLLIDASDSMSRGFNAERDAAANFLRSVIRPGTDHCAVASFSTHLALDPAQDASSPQTLLRVGMLHSEGLTALYDSLYESAAAFREYGGEHSASRRVLVLLSDGDDNYSLHSLDAAIAAAQISNVVIYAISAHNPRVVYQGDPVLSKLTAETGGRSFVIKKFEDSDKAFREIVQEIRGQYTATFRPARDACGYHSLRVEPKDPSLRARSRAGFYGDCQ